MRTSSLVSLGLLVGMLLILATGAGCLGSQTGDQQTTTGATDRYTLEGTIVDARTGNGVPDVSVAVNDHTDETDANGTFVVEDVPAGEYRVVATKPGYMRSEINITMAGDRTVRFTLRDEAFYEPDQSPLVNTHWEADVRCQFCHEAPEDEITAPPPDGTCIECHSLAEIRNETGNLEPNPHDDPHGLAQDCDNCHKVHEASVDKCADCHSSDTIPAVP